MTKTTRLAIERLELDLRGIDPATARAVARQLGAELGRALTPAALPARHIDTVDAGRVAAATPDAGTLAAGIAGQVAAALRRRQP